MAFRAPQELINPILFFVIVASLFPLAISPDANILRMIAPGVIWVAALLATLISLNRLFKSDYDDGSLEQLVISPNPLSILAVAKVVSHWLLTGLPLIIITPLIGIMYGLSWTGIYVMMLSLLIGTPILSFLGGIGSALTVGLRSSGVLLTLVVLPFYIPVLIFGAGAVAAAVSGLPYGGQLAILGALLALTITLCPFAIAGSLRICVNY
jgi:heme exporter protein B